MSSMESFYGGRQGASFVIVKRFDGIDIPEQKLRRGYFAWENNEFVIESDSSGNATLVERSLTNADRYKAWEPHLKDGSTYTSSVSGLSADFPLEYAEGMLQCFSQGGATTSEVGYGEYVIIDTISGLHNYSSIDNGKVFRRGMDYNDPGSAGAQLVGQIVGPRGHATEVDVDSYEYIVQNPGAKYGSGIYSEETGDLVPGKDLSTGTYVDDIKYAWTDIIDPETGDISKALIGFQFPYLVAEFFATKRSPYYETEEEAQAAGKEVGDFIDDPNFEYIVDTSGDTTHPFSRVWRLRVPQGIKGDSAENFRIQPTLIREGSDLWDNENLSGDPAATADDNTVITEFNSSFLKVEKEGDPYYAKPEDAWKLKVQYNKVTYENKVAGEEVPQDAGYFDTITDAYIDTGDTEGEGTQKLNLEWENGRTVPVGNPINYIMEVTVTTYDASTPTTPSGRLLVLYSDPAYRQELARLYPDKIRSYPSQKFSEIREDWFDLGEAKGDPGSVSILCEIRTATDPHEQLPSELVKDGRNIPPEEIDKDGHPAGDAYRGWCVIINYMQPGTTEPYQGIQSLWGYDYLNSRWFQITCLGVGDGITDPTQLIIIDEAKVVEGKEIPNNPEYVELPRIHGLWFVLRDTTAVY